jgi:hypothetical protein
MAAQGKRIIALPLVITRATSANIRRWGDDDLVELRRESQNKPIWRAGTPTDHVFKPLRSRRKVMRAKTVGGRG